MASDVRDLLIAIAQANGHEDGAAWADKVLANLAAIEAPAPAPDAPSAPAVTPEVPTASAPADPAPAADSATSPR